MRLPSFEEVIDKWTPAHTVAVAAWVVVLVLGVVLLTRHLSGGYPATDKLRVYAGENATLTYPANWSIYNCVPGRPFIELPGTIKADYRGRQAYQFTIHGAGSYNCVKDRPQRFDIYSEEIVARENPCSMATSTRGERLANGLYLELQDEEGYVLGVRIKQNSCFAPMDGHLLQFSFVDPAAEPSDVAKFGAPKVKKEAFLASRQYQDIRALAESIRY